VKTKLIELAAAALLLAASAPAWAINLAEETALLAQNKSGEARFTEERYVTGFDGPLRAAGTLSFQAPDRFTRTTTEPRGEAMEVQGNTLVLKRSGRTRQMTVDAIPEVATLIEAVRGTLTGNAVLLDKLFKTQVEGNAARWTLTLVPRDARLATQVRELKITGLQGDMRSVELWLAGGDRSVMAIDPLQPLQTLSPAKAPK
jgi:hypothetical protein